MTHAGGNDLPIPYAPMPPSGPSPRSGASIIISWTVIAAAVLLIFTLNQLESHLPPAAESGGVNPNVQMEMTARYVVGSTHLLPPTTDATATYLKQMDAAAQTTPDRLREIAVVGEVQGGAEALSRIKALAGQLSDAPLRGDATTLSTVYTAGPSRLTARQRDELVSRYGWFGRLALGFKQPADDPDRQATIHEAIRGFAAMAGMIVIVLIAICVGVVLLIIALVRYADGKIHRAYVRPAADTAPFLEAFAVYLGGSIVIGLLVGRFSGHLHINFVYLLATCVPVGLAMVWPLWRGVNRSDWRSGLGWHTGTGVFREIFWGLTVYVAGLPLIALAALLTIALSRWAGVQPTHPIVNQVAEPGAALRLYLLAAVFAPLAEESVFRGALFHHLRARHGWWVSAIVVSLIFAALHPQGWTAIPALGMIAMTFAAIREWRGTVIASAAAHALNNAAVVTVLVLVTS